MLTAREGVLLSNGVFLQDEDFIKITYDDGDIIEGQIEYFTKYGLVIITDSRGYLEDFEIDFANECLKDIQLM